MGDKFAMDFKIIFIGMGQYTIGCLEQVIEKYKVVGIIQSIRKKEKYTMLDIVAVKYGKLRKFATNHNIPYMYTDDLNGEKVLNFLKKADCNLICVASAGQLLKGEIFNVPQYGILNAHSSLLPEYRGANPTYWIFRNQEKVGGITIHYIDKGMDTGNFLVQKEFDIPYKYSLTEYDKKISELAGECYVQVLNGLTDGSLQPKPQVGTGKYIARRVSSSDYCMNLDKMPASQVYHFLYGTDGINKIYEGVFFDYSIGDAKQGKSERKLDIVCKDGYIPVFKSFNFKNCILKCLFKFLSLIPIKKYNI